MCHNFQIPVLSLATFIQFGAVLTPKEQSHPNLLYRITELGPKNNYANIVACSLLAVQKNAGIIP
jgi:hypothetical protein